MIGPTERQSYLDWLRVLTVILLVPFHSALPFIFGYYWWITSVQKNLALHIFVSVLDQYHMPLLFTVAGAATWFSLGVRSAKEYVIERTRRLLVPFIFCSITLVAAQHYLSQHYYFYFDPVNQRMVRLGLIKPFGSFLQYYPDILLDKLVPFSREWNAGELWFISYLFLYSMVLLPIFVLIRRKGGHFVSWIQQFFEKRGTIFLLAIPIALIQIFPPPHIGNIWQFANFPFFYYIFFFVYGFFLVSGPQIQDGLKKSGPIAVVGGIITMTIFVLLVLPWPHQQRLGTIYWTALGSHPGSTGRTLLLLLESINGWFWIVALLYLGRRFLNFSNRFLRYANEAVLPFYLIHGFAIVLVGFFILKLNVIELPRYAIVMRVLPRYAIIVACSYAMTLALYEMIRRTNMTRFLFGMRLKKKSLSEHAASRGGASSMPASP